MKFFFNLYLASIPISEKHSGISSLELLVISGCMKYESWQEMGQRYLCQM